MNISIFGLGYVGAVSMACLARDGHKVLGVDVDPVKLDLISRGKSPVIEAGMPELMESVFEAGRIMVTDDVQIALKETDVSFICVGTPPKPNGSQDQSAIIRLSEQIGKSLKNKKRHHTIIFRSTLIPGTVENQLIPIIEDMSSKNHGVDFDVCFQPEFLREGTSIKDYENPPYTIVGATSKNAYDLIKEIFSKLPGEYLKTDIRTAETVKYFCNIFHALKISFANEVGRLCESMSVDPHDVMSLLCKDKHLNISSAYLKPGFAFGGSCLPKDLKAMQYIAKLNDIEIPMISSILGTNREHLKLAASKVLSSGVRDVSIIGLSFKSGTDDLRSSPLVDLAEYLIGKGIHLRIFDPEVNLSFLIGSNKRYIEETIPHIGELLTDDLIETLSFGDMIVVGLSDIEILDVIQNNIKTEQTLLDLVNMTNKEDLKCHYQGVCWE